MATVIRTICDSHQAIGEAVDGRQVTYYDPFTGKPYEMDLCDNHALAAASSVQDFVELLAKQGTVAKPQQGQLIETEEGQLPCLKEGCDTTWRNKGSRSQHVTRVHPELCDPCPFCESRSLNLDMHVRQSHHDEHGAWKAKQAA